MSILQNIHSYWAYIVLLMLVVAIGNALLGKFMNKTTIYRILDKLEDDGILHSFIGFDGVKRLARCKSCSKSNHSDVHPHFQCISCGKSECLDIEVNIPQMSNREVLFSQLLIKGKCDLCMV